MLILFFGKRMPRGGSEIGIAAVGIAFILAILTAGQWIGEVEGADDAVPHEEAAIELAVGDEFAAAEEGLGAAEGEAAAGAEGEEGGHEAAPGAGAVVESHTWFEIGPYEITIGTLVDGLTVSLLIVVTLISLLVHVYSTDYVAGDRRYTHFFAFLSLFTASMLFFVVSESTLQMIVGWELVGVCSFVLIGHWWEEQENSDAALKAFLTNRVGDVGLLIGVSILFFAAGGTFSIVEINTLAVTGGDRTSRRCWWRRSVSSLRSCPRAASSSCTPGCPTPWPAPRRCPRSSTRPRWSSRASTWSPGSTACSSKASPSAAPASTCWS